MGSIADLPAGLQRVCIYGEEVAGALEGNVVGGAELQTALLARSLAQEGYNVTVIDPRAPADAATADGVRVRTVPGWDRGTRGMRMFTRRIPALLRICRAVDPGVLYMRGFSFLFMVLLLFARASGALTVLALASDMDVAGFRKRYNSFYRRNASLRRWITEIIPNHLTGWLTLRWADVVLYQHPGQADLLPRPGTQLSNIVPDDLFRLEPAPSRANILMVGLLAAHKGIRELLPVIRHLPDLTFEFVGAPSGREGRSIEEKLRQCPNVVLHGPLRRTETLRKISAADVLLNVSPAEGFPNTFLEAWALGTPVLSLWVDPAGVIAAHGLGLVCGGSMDALVQALRSGSYRVEAASLARYVRTHHSMAAAAELFTGAVREAAARKGHG